LEGEAPSLRLLVIDFEEVNIFIGSDILPIAERLIENDKFREVLSDNLEDGRLATSNISLDRNKLRPV
jgi:hypothetical protein